MGGKERRRTVTFRVRKKDEWLMREIEKRVEIKRELGMRVTLGAELMRLVMLGWSGQTSEEVESRAREFRLGKEQEDVSGERTGL